MVTRKQIVALYLVQRGQGHRNLLISQDFDLLKM